MSKTQIWLFWYTREWRGDGNGTPLQYSCLEYPMDGGAWCAAVHRVARSQTQLSDFTFTFHFHALEKEMATHSSVLAWIIPGTGEPGGLPSMGSHRVGHDWSDLAAVAAAENEEKLKSLLTKVKEESEKVGSKLNIQKAKILASGPITLWQIEGEKVEAVTDFIFLGSKITVDGDCSHEIEKTLAPWKERYDQPRQCIKKQTSLWWQRSI